MASTRVVSITVTSESVTRAIRELSMLKNGASRAIVSGINDAGRRFMTRVNRGIRDTVNIKKKDLDKHIKLSKASFARPVSTLVVSGRRKDFPLSYFSARQTKAGVKYKIRKSGPAQTIKGAFLATVVGTVKGQLNNTSSAMRRTLRQTLGESQEQISAASHRGVYRRRGKRRLPIDERFGISAVGVLRENKELMDRLVGEASEHAAQRINHHVDRMLRNMQKRGT